MSELEKNKPRIGMIAVGAVSLSIILAVMLRFQVVERFAFLEKLNEEKELVYLTRFFELVFLFAPVVILAALLGAIFKSRSLRLPLAAQREKLWISVILFVFTYLCLLPPVLRYTDIAVETASVIDMSAEKYVSCFEKCYTWFVVQLIPFGILISYHAARVQSLKRELSFVRSADAGEAAAAETESGEPSEAREVQA